jgi:hypothetical protein
MTAADHALRKYLYDNRLSCVMVPGNHQFSNMSNAIYTAQNDIMVPAVDKKNIMY